MKSDNKSAKPPKQQTFLVSNQVGSAVVDGTITLSLRVAVAAGEAIRVGGISLDFTPN
jgi:hypothetical protein